MHVCLCELFFPGLGLRYIGSCLVVVWLFVWFSYGLYAPIRNLIGLNDNLPAHKIPFHMKFLAYTLLVVAIVAMTVVVGNTIVGALALTLVMALRF